MYVIYYYYVYIICNSYNMRPSAMYCPTDAPLANPPLFTAPPLPGQSLSQRVEFNSA